MNAQNSSDANQKNISLILGNQTLLCHGYISEELYLGQLPEPINDNEILNYWKEFEETIEDMMLSVLNEVQNRMQNYQIIVIYDGDQYPGKDIDLQIYPSTAQFSFKVPEN